MTRGPEPFYKSHWRRIGEARLARYRAGFQWSEADRLLYASADIGAGHRVADFGAGPGHTAVEMARWVGAEGHVFAFDINPDFVAETRRNAQLEGLGKRITAAEADGRIPLEDQSLDRVSTRTTLMYVDDPLETLRDFRRVLRPGGRIHAVEADWPLLLFHPVPAGQTAQLVAAAAHACATPDMGRRLADLAQVAGFRDIQVEVVTIPDSDGAQLGMLESLVSYARRARQLPDAALDDITSVAREAVVKGRWLALSPKFVVTGRA